uniref:Baseplate component n=1 Tax=Siphoviridae sp. ctdm01 TaxID=2825585 RepID=A0A8S5R3J5_9CAUD|nr:MAG TPA: Baseplate component [Siphoviridae sp. ctdm01]
MNKQCYRKSLDLQKNGVQWSVDIKKNDVNSRKIVISLTDGGKTFNLDENMIVTVYAKKPDENIIYSNCKIESGLVIFEPTKQCISAEGTVNCELRIYSANSSGSQLLTSPRFSIEVYGILSNEEHLVSTNEYSALTEATLKAQEATDKANDVTDEITQKLENGELKGEKGEQGPQGEQGIQGVPGTTDYTALQNLPRTLCSGTLELTAIADGGYEASDATSVTYNGVEKFKLDKGNLLFLKDNTVNIQTGFGCYCIDSIPEKVNDDWTDYYGVTEKELQDEIKTVNSALGNHQRSFDADNGLSFNRTKTILSLNNGSTVLKKADMLTAITDSGRYDIAESGDMLIGFPGVTDFTPFTLKVVKGDIVKILFDTIKNVTDILYIGDISPNMTEKEIASTKKYIKNPLFDMTIFELNVDSEQKCYKENSIMESLYINPFTDIYDLICRVDNIPSGSIGLIMATSKKDEFGNYLYRKVSLASGLTMETSATATRLKVLPAQLNLSESNITYEHEGTNDETLKAFAENVYSYIDDLQAQIDELKKAIQPTNSEVSEN